MQHMGENTMKQTCMYDTKDALLYKTKTQQQHFSGKCVIVVVTVETNGTKAYSRQCMALVMKFLLKYYISMVSV